MDEWPKMYGPIKMYDHEFSVAWDMLLGQGFAFDIWDGNTSVLEWQRLIHKKINGSFYPVNQKTWYHWELNAKARDGYEFLFTYHHGWVRQGDTEVLFMELQKELDGKNATWDQPWAENTRYQLWTSTGPRTTQGYPPWAAWFDCQQRGFKLFGRTYQQTVQELAERAEKERLNQLLQPSTS